MVDGALNGYAIGDYEARSSRRSRRYEPPRGFVEAAEPDHDLLVAPHFTLGQFLCKQPGEPRYVALTPELVLKLERCSSP